jgi:hypothetical protein
MTTALKIIQGSVSLVDQDPVVSRLVQAHSMLAEANTVQKAKQFVDAAITAEVYIKRTKLGEDTESLALLIKVDALKNLGEVLAATPRAVGGKPVTGYKSEPVTNDVPTLSDMGLDKRTSSIAQKLAALPDAELENVRTGNLTIAKAIAAADVVKAKKPTPAPLPVAPVVESFGDDDWEKEFIRVSGELTKAHTLIEALQKDDMAKEVAKWAMKFDQLEGRLQLAITQKNEADKDAKYAQGYLAKIRKELNVEKTSEIIGAIQDLKR